MKLKFVTTILILFIVLLCIVETIDATHLRMGSMAWSSTGVNKRKLNLKFRLAMRRSTRWIANTNVGSQNYPGTVKWGDGKRNCAGPKNNRDRSFRIWTCKLR